MTWRIVSRCWNDVASSPRTPRRASRALSGASFRPSGAAAGSSWAASPSAFGLTKARSLARFCRLSSDLSRGSAAGGNRGFFLGGCSRTGF